MNDPIQLEHSTIQVAQLRTTVKQSPKKRHLSDINHTNFDNGLGTSQEGKSQIIRLTSLNTFD